MFQAYYVFWQAAYVAILSGFVTFYVFGALGFQQWQLVALERILIVIAAGMSGLFITKVIHEFLTPGLVVKDVIALGFQSTSTYYVLAGLLEESSKIAIGIALFFVFRRTGMRLPDAVILSALSFAWMENALYLSNLSGQYEALAISTGNPSAGDGEIIGTFFSRSIFSMGLHFLSSLTFVTILFHEPETVGLYQLGKISGFLNAAWNAVFASPVYRAIAGLSAATLMHASYNVALTYDFKSAAMLIGCFALTIYFNVVLQRTR